MSARAVWLIALGAALSGLIVLDYFRSPERGSVDANLAPRAPSLSRALPQDERLAMEPPAHEHRGAPDATVATGSPAPAAPQSASVLLPNQVPATPMSQALEDLQMPAIPELLETEREFAAQSRDPAWATATEAQVLRQIAGIAGLALVSLNVECRTTLCRLQFVQPGTVPGLPSGSAVFPSPDRAPNGVSITDLIPATGLKSRWVIAVRDRNGTPISLAYLDRVSDAPVPPGR